MSEVCLGLACFGYQSFDPWPCRRNWELKLGQLPLTAAAKRANQWCTKLCFRKDQSSFYAYPINQYLILTISYVCPTNAIIFTKTWPCSMLSACVCCSWLARWARFTNKKKHTQKRWYKLNNLSVFCYHNSYQ